MARYAVGDIQGCFDSLQQLLQKINFDWQIDELWCAGDLINRGPKSLETLRFLYTHRDKVKIVLGNHDLHFLAVYYGLREESVSDTLKEILQAPDVSALVDWLRRQPLLIWDESSDLLMAHAGVAPMWNPSQAVSLAGEVTALLASDQIVEFLSHMYGNEPAVWSDDLQGMDRYRCITNYLTRMRFCNLNGELDLISKESASDALPEFKPWFDFLPKSYPRVIFGHWAALKGKSTHPKAIALDTGCVWGGSLTAVNLDNGQRVSCDCPQDDKLTQLFVSKRKR